MAMPKESREDWMQPKTGIFSIEVVICAAVVGANGDVIRCHRHSDGLRGLAERGIVYGDEEDSQGFITSFNRYVNRIEAKRIQQKARIQSANPSGYSFDDRLFSEDLY